MRLNVVRGATIAAACALLVSCAEKVNAPSQQVAGAHGTMDVAPGAKVVISQIYGSGGNSNALFQNDFIELFNAGTATQSLAGWSVQYTSATGTGLFGGASNLIATLTGSIEPGQYYLVRLAGGATGAPVATFDASGTINMSGSAGKVALADIATGLGCNGGSTACSATALSHIIDLVGYGTGSGGANFFEGAAAAPSLSAILADSREDHGCTDTNNNGADFVAGTPTLRTTATAKAPCDVVVGSLADVTIGGPSAVNSGSTIVLTATLKDASDNGITDPAATYSWSSSDNAIASVQSTSDNTATILGGVTPGVATITVEATSNGVTKTSTIGASVTVTGPLDHVSVAGPAIVATGANITLTATLKDAIDQTITDAAATYTWTSASPAVAQVVSTENNTATIGGLVPGGPVAINLSVTSNGVTNSPSPQPAVTVTGAPVIVPSTTYVSEAHYDNAGTDVDEKIEIEGNAGASLDGWKLVLYDGNGGKRYSTNSTFDLSGIIPSNCDNGRGVVVLTFPVNGIQNGSPDGWALINPANQITEFTSYEGTMTANEGPALGLTSTDIGVSEATDTPLGRSVQRAGNGVWFGPKKQTFGACNRPLPPPPDKLILRDGKDLLALGMQTQWFFDDNSGTGVTSVVWSSSDPTIFTVDSRGIVTAKKLGVATLTATAVGDPTIIGTAEIEIYLAPTSSGIRLGHNEEFGEPRDADAGDDFLIHRAQYTVSYNKFRGGANWVSWNLSASHVGDVGRCSGTCYSADTALINAGITAYTTADWVSGGIWDRGHMAPSADWTASEADNNTTFFLSNFLPQAPDLNQGPWERLESALRDTVGAGREIYIIAGGIFTGGVGLGSIQGKIQIPDSTWKIAVIVPAGQGIGAGGTLPPNTTVLAVNMPNVQGIRGVDWQTWITTIDKIQRSTGYDFLDLLSEPTECLAEGRNCAPTARITGASLTTSEGQSLSFSAATSTDPNAGDMLTKEWYVNGAPSGSGDSFTYTFPNDGSYEVKLIVTDLGGVNSTAVATVSISNVVPVLNPFSGATILVGETYSVNGTFTDPGADTWTGTVNFGDGSTSSFSPGGHAFTLSHAYATAGTYTVTVSVSDGVAASTKTATVIVKSASEGIADLDAAVVTLGLSKGQANSLQAKLANAAKQVRDGNSASAANVLGAFINEVTALAEGGRISNADAAQLIALAQRVIAAM
jgi:DNA/RNA endonuclease G (NUC1)/PKD repeat protein